MTAITRALAAIGRPPHEIAFISGIGCSSRIPGYTTAYGFNTVHGRSLPIAQGIKLANPELLVLVASGDGDGFSIGGGHVAHVIRRNIDLTYIVMDNQIYGLTKGQLSPTSQRGRKTVTSSFGSLEDPVNPLLYVMGYGASFVAQGSPADMAGLARIIEEGIRFPGFAFINVQSPCVTYGEEEQQLKAQKAQDAEPGIARSRSGGPGQCQRTGARIRDQALHGNPLSQPQPAADLRPGRGRAPASAQEASGAAARDPQPVHAKHSHLKSALPQFDHRRRCPNNYLSLYGTLIIEPAPPSRPQAKATGRAPAVRHRRCAAHHHHIRRDLPPQAHCGMPRRFGTSVAVLIIVTMYAVLFAAMQTVQVLVHQRDPVLFVMVTIFVTGVGLSQAVLFHGHNPRRASILTGFVLGTAIALARFFQERQPGIRLSPEQFVVIVFYVLSGFGGLGGYVVGGVIAGVFLLLNRVQPPLEDPEDDGPARERKLRIRRPARERGGRIEGRRDVSSETLVQKCCSEIEQASWGSLGPRSPTRLSCSEAVASESHRDA